MYQSRLSPYYSSGMPMYGAFQPDKQGLEQPTLQRRRINVVVVIGILLVPTLVFMSTFGLLSFHLHFTRPVFCWLLVCAELVAVAMVGLRAWQSIRRRRAGEADPERTWISFLFVSTSAAWILALLLGLWNYRSQMLPYYKLVTLNTYTNVDTAQISGSGVMDAGRITFETGSYIDTSKAMGFKKVDTYCVAPVTSSRTPLLQYDFWAAGVNCCSGAPGDFHCGEVNGKLYLGGGQRVLNEGEIPWFTLATQQAESFHHIEAGHKIFFKNVVDPLGEEGYQIDKGTKFFCLWSLLFFGLHVFTVIMFYMSFSQRSC